MNTPKVSVVIPAYNGKTQLCEAIQSILDQTYVNFEIIVVDDASPEDVSPFVNSFTDARLRYIRHENNKGAVAARKSGVNESKGEIIAFLDQDDLYHKRKLEIHLDYFLKNPSIGMTYNDRFEIIGSDMAIRGIYRPPSALKLADWILGFPISPSDIVLKREWALRDEIWDDSFASQAEHVIFNGQEIVFGGRLGLAGCKFGYIGQALNYRRYHPCRSQRHLSARCKAELACQDIVFSDPRCPEDVRALKNLASANIYLIWAYTAYLQEEFELGKRFLKHAISLQPQFFIDRDPNQFLNTWLFWMSDGTADCVRGHEEILHSIFENLPMELRYLQNKYDWAVARIYLLKGLRALIWGESVDAELYLRTAFDNGIDMDNAAVDMFSNELLNYEFELGSKAAQKIVEQFSKSFSKLDRNKDTKTLTGVYALNRAFRNYYTGSFQNVPGDVVRAFIVDHKHLLNKGALSILFRSVYAQVKA